MIMDYWKKQTKDEPLFPELLWSRPENKKHAGKLLIIGCNSFGFSAVGEAYNAAIKAGAGTVKVLLPDKVQKVAGLMLENGEYAASTQSGSFAQKALLEWLELSAWADGVLIAGDLGKNSETAILIEKYLEKFTGAVTITKDAVDYVTNMPEKILERSNTTLVLSLAQLQKLGLKAKLKTAITFNMDMLHLVESLHELTTQTKIEIILQHLDTVFVAVHGRVSTTKLEAERPIWRVETATATSVWSLQNPTKPFEAATTAVTEVFD